jgi:hypothetical protein
VGGPVAAAGDEPGPAPAAGDEPGPAPAAAVADDIPGAGDADDAGRSPPVPSSEDPTSRNGGATDALSGTISTAGSIAATAGEPEESWCRPGGGSPPRPSGGFASTRGRLGPSSYRRPSGRMTQTQPLRGSRNNRQPRSCMHTW